MESNEPDFRTEPAGDGLNNVYINGVKQPGTYTIYEAALLCDSMSKKRHKTADEMFAELGYTQKEYEGSRIIYRNDSRQTEIICFLCGMYFEIFYKDEFVCFRREEILACAQLIKEMEEANGND